MRFFKGPTPNSTSSALEINKVIFGNYFNQIENNQKNKIMVMLPEGDLGDHPCLNAFKELTEQEAYIEARKLEWQKPQPW